VRSGLSGPVTPRPKNTRTNLPHLLLDRDQMLYVVLPEGALDGSLTSALAESARVVGSSARLATPARLPEAVQEARWALGAAEAENRTLVRYGDQTALLLPRSVTEAQALVSRILGPLVTHDAEHGTAYVDTLRVMLRYNRS
jgi:purine catabolism regulator